MNNTKISEHVGWSSEILGDEAEERLSFEHTADIEADSRRWGLWMRQNCFSGYVSSSSIRAEKDNSPNYEPRQSDSSATVGGEPRVSDESQRPVVAASLCTSWWRPRLSSFTDNDAPLQITKGSGQRSFYLDMWKKHCIPALHPALGRLGTRSDLPSIVQDAVLALSACHLSRRIPREKPFDPAETPGLSFKPDPGHQIVSLEVYGSVLISLARCYVDVHTANIDLILTSTVLLAHFELLMGNFRQFGSHSMGATTLLSYLETAGTIPHLWACELIANWTQAKAHSWWLRLHFSTPDFHLSSKSQACSLWLMDVLEKSTDSRAAIMSALCECCRLKSIALLEGWGAIHFGSKERLSKNYHFGKPVFGPALPYKAAWSATPAVTAQRAFLDRWYKGLATSEQPIEAMEQSAVTAFYSEWEPLDVRPLRFVSHQAAMNYAYYVVSRLLLSQIAIEDPECRSPNSYVDSIQEANSWAFMLARITAGLNWTDCTRLNTFVIGLSTLFLPCALGPLDIRISLWMQNWLEQRYATDALEEGSFPVLQSLQALRIVHGERRKGRISDVLFSCIEDEGGAGKYGSYNSQNFTSLLVYGHDISTGQAFSRTVGI